jgi:ABC-type nitrate/sulfonate/bicarbonate transport system, ATPase component
LTSANPSPRPANEAIRFDYVSVEFKRRQGDPVLALDNFDLSVAEGRFVSLVGPSGCGKSTALRLVAGLTEVTRGQVRVVGAGHLRGFSRVAVVFQSPNLLPWKTVIDNVMYPVRFGSPASDFDYRARARELLDMVGLSRFADAYPAELSGGMQQRVAICRSLILDPKILLMDEPFSALDALTREELQFELRRIHQHTGKTILFVTHSISESVLLADEIVVMAPRPGRLKDRFDVRLPPERTPTILHHPDFPRYADRVREGIYGKTAA